MNATCHNHGIDLSPGTAVGRGLRMVRVARGMTQKQMALQLGIVRQTLIGYEKDAPEPPSSILVKTCRQFDVNSGWLLLGEVSREMFATTLEGVR